MKGRAIGGFECNWGPHVICNRVRGGGLQFPDDWCCTTDFTYLSHTAVVIPCESARPCRTGERGTRATPPPKVGGHVTPNSGTELHTAYSAPRGSLSSSFIPAGRLGTAPPEGVLTERVRYPFPSRCMIPDRSSPSRVRFAASRPGPLRADPRDVLFTREKGGRVEACRAERNLSAIPAPCPAPSVEAISGRGK